MGAFNIYLIGVGGQGIGLLSEVILRAADHAGRVVKGVDTHGLAQRGGVVVSQIRIGEPAWSPLIPGGEADMVIALERHEALRGMSLALKDNGLLVYYDAVWQPLEVRLKQAPEVRAESIRTEADRRNIRLHGFFRKDLADARRQNIVLLAGLAARGLIPGVGPDHYRRAMDDLMHGRMLEMNRSLFEEELRVTD